MLCQLLQSTLLDNSHQMLANQFIIARPPNVALPGRRLAECARARAFTVAIVPIKSIHCQNFATPVWQLSKWVFDVGIDLLLRHSLHTVPCTRTQANSPCHSSHTKRQWAAQSACIVSVHCLGATNAGLQLKGEGQGCSLHTSDHQALCWAYLQELWDASQIRYVCGTSS